MKTLISCEGASPNVVRAVCLQPLTVCVESRKNQTNIPTCFQLDCQCLALSMEFSCMAQWRPLTVRQVRTPVFCSTKMFVIRIHWGQTVFSVFFTTLLFLHKSFTFPPVTLDDSSPRWQTFSEAISPLTEEVKKYSRHDYIMFCVKFMLEKVYCDPVSWNLSLRGVLFHRDSQVNKYIFKPLHGCILLMYTNWSSLLGENERRGE